MAETFQDLGLAPELIAGAGDVGWDHPTPLQQDAIPVLRRGNNLVLHASTGAGVTGAWGLPVLDRVTTLAPGNGPLALVLAPSTDEASRTATILARLAAPAGLAVRALAPGWSGSEARVLVATPPAALAAVRDSTLKLDGLAILVVQGADRSHALGDWDTVRTLTESVAAAEQKVVVTGELGGPVAEYVDRHLRKALTIPPQPAVEDGAPPGGSVRYALAAEDRKIDALVALLADATGSEVAVVCRTPGGATEVEAALRARGMAIEGADPAAAGDGPRVLVLPRHDADRRSTRATVISRDVPFDATGLAELHGNGGTVLATPAELPHLRRVAARAGLRLQPHPLPEPGSRDTAEAARDALRQALGDADLAAYLSLIQPLLDEYPAAEVAAAALFLARGRGTTHADPGASGRAGQRGAATGTGAARASGGSTGAGAPPPSTAFVRLFISVGSRDDVTPGDIVGAITGEAGVPGETVGRIDLRESHSTVEVASSDADRIIQALNGRTLKGRSLRVDYDRKDRATAPGRGPARGAPRSGGRPRGGAGAGGSRGGSRGGPGGGSRGGSRGGSGGGSRGGSRDSSPRGTGRRPGGSGDA